MRSLTVRSWSPERRQIVLDIVPHDGGVAGPWARTAQPGQVVYLTKAMGWYAPPDDLAWQLLVADLTGVPALERIVEELPDSARAYVLVEVPDPADRPRYRSTILGYWRVDQEAWLDRYARIGTELEQVYVRAVAAGHSSDEALELYDDAVDAAGL